MTTAYGAPGRLPTRARLAARLVVGLVWAIDAGLKWQPGFRHNYASDITGAADGQPGWLHWWFHLWTSSQTVHPAVWATLVAVSETLIAVVVLLGVARRVSYPLAMLFSLAIWSIGEGFGGPYDSTSTDIGTAVIYAVLLGVLLLMAPRGSEDDGSLDAALVQRHPWWTRFSDVGRPRGGAVRGRESAGVS